MPIPLFKSKKRKANEAELARLKKEGEGEHKVTSRRADDPRGGGRKSLRKGDTAFFTKKTTTSRGSGGSHSTTQELVPSKKITHERFEAQDRNPNTANKRYTTQHIGAKLKENPQKTSRREGLQYAATTGGDIKKAGGHTIETPEGKKLLVYDFGKRKNELAGEYKKTEFKVPETKHTLTTPAAEPVTKEKRNIAVRKLGKRRGVTLGVSRHGGYDKKGRSQNYLKVNMAIHKKHKPDKTVTLAKWKTKTRRTPNKK